MAPILQRIQLHITYFFEFYMSKFTLIFKTLPNEARVFAVAFSLFVVAALMFASLLYFGV